ncbi:hypothetical protein BGZ58_007799 [Dissophora ornata]|nr:hypothetical protein BGZ58_007799 [Dissophora ornata]
MKLSAALKDILVGVENAQYFSSTAPVDYDAKEYFRGVGNRQKVHRLWAYTIIPRLIANKHSGLQEAGMRLQKQWINKVYREGVEAFWKEQQTIHTSQVTITRSAQMHQARILQHSYEDLCHNLDKREEHFHQHGEEKSETELALQEPDASDLVVKEHLAQDEDDHYSEGSELSEKEEEDKDPV